MHIQPLSPERKPRLLSALFSSCFFAVLLANSANAQDNQPNTDIDRCNPCVGFEATSSDNATGLIDLATDDASQIFMHLLDSSAPETEYDGPFELVIDANINTPAPLTTNANALAVELQQLSERLERSSSAPRVRLRWTGGSPAQSPADWNFLIKRTAVAVTGARPGAKLLVGFEVPDAAELTALIEEDLAAYIDGIAFVMDAIDAERSEGLKSFREALITADPDSELVILGLATGADTTTALASAARVAEIGGQIATFDLGTPSLARAAPLRLWSQEFAGDITFDPYSTPKGANAWSFVRGEDLALRVVVEKPAGVQSVDLAFTDRTLTTPTLLMADAEPQSLFGGRRARPGYRLDVQSADVPAAFLVALERQGLGALEGVDSVEEQVNVADTRRMPVGEILRRLQASEDAQSRRLENYAATNSMSLRFLLGGAQSLDTTFRGPYFFNADGGFDWAWEEFFVNGVRWRRKTIPEIPLIQPEKAAAQPIDINFTKDYSYQLRGTAVIDGRDTWVVDFSPRVKPEEGRTLYKGTVWVDRELYVRVRSNAIQLGLIGDVISNEETTTYTPLTANGAVAPWSREAFILGTRVKGQQLFSILSGTTLVEREVELTDVQINPSDFEQRRQTVLDSEATMVRDTEKGLRYLATDKSGERVVKDEFDKSRLFLVGGVFYDDSQDFPLPLAGINYFNFDWRDTGIQVNLFFAGPLLLANVADPSLFGTRWEGGIDAFGLAIAGEDQVFRNEVEVKEEGVKALRPNIDFNIGRPIGQFFKLGLEYSIGFNNFSRGDDTAPEFVLPEDHIDHRIQLTADYNRKGFSVRLRGSENMRSDWEPWGLPGNTEFDQDQESYQRYSASVRKIWHLPKFTKFGAQLEYAGGENLDRFSKYDFGFFSDLVIRGYSSGKVKAEEVTAAHLSYGFNLGDVFRIDLVGDAALATDFESGFKDELLAGIGLNGTVLGPWGTVVNFDIGYPVAGPADGFTAFIAFLKLFNR